MSSAHREEDVTKTKALSPPRGAGDITPSCAPQDAVAFCFEELQDMEDSCHDEHILLLPSQLNPCQQESNRMQAGMESAPSWVWWPDQDVKLWLR